MKPEIALYNQCVSEIKARMEHVRREYVRMSRLNAASIIDFEGACLQLRKVIEIIAFASLVTNRELYEKEWTGFRRDNDFSVLAKRLVRINLNCLPTSVTLLGQDVGGTWQMVDNDVQLEMERLVTAHGRLGNILHARNPYRPPVNVEECQRFHGEMSKYLISALQYHVAILATGEHIMIQMMGNDEPVRSAVLRDKPDD